MGHFKVIWCGRKTASCSKSFILGVSACVRINGEASEHFEIKMGLTQRCFISPWLFNIHMDRVMREMKRKVWDVGVKMYTEGRK